LELPETFSGIVKLFPLPNLVLFPGIIQPLHIFELRYRRLMEDALASDRLITMALIRGDQAPSGQPPRLHPTVCIGRILTHTRLEDGRFNLLLIGVRRARLVREVLTDLPYRLAEVNLIEEQLPSDLATALSTREELVGTFRQWVNEERPLECDSVGRLLCDEVPLGALADLIAFSSGGPPAKLQAILAETDVVRRACLVLKLIREQLGRPASRPRGADTRFPPKFSYN